MEEINKLKNLERYSDEEIAGFLDTVESKLVELSDKELKELFSILVNILTKRRGFASKRAEEILDSLYPKMRWEIIHLLWSDIPYIRNTALTIIAHHKDREATLKLIKDKDKDIRKFALDIAFEMGDTEILEMGLDDDDPNVVVSSAEYLARLGSDAALGKIIDKVRQTPLEDIYLLLFLFESLIRLGYPDSAKVIREKFPDVSDPLIKDIYIRACGISSDIKYIDFLLSVLDDESVRKLALESIFSIIRQVQVKDEEMKNKIRREIESRLTKMNPSELEVAGKILTAI
ncbi:MAG: HEAT repeat domain-containing protein [Candidatus Calescibacterium sp.]|jgi:HEAT repeat protein|nr:HEAT repeat domain-containing protein [Candidatus Calescibacterium sp.]